jgi:hypothetical protein
LSSFEKSSIGPGTFLNFGYASALFDVGRIQKLLNRERSAQARLLAAFRDRRR